MGGWVRHGKGGGDCGLNEVLGVVGGWVGGGGRGGLNELCVYVGGRSGLNVLNGWVGGWVGGWFPYLASLTMALLRRPLARAPKRRVERVSGAFQALNRRVGGWVGG